MTSKIEWCDEVWNPVTGCTQISDGCRNCYAKRMANRLRGRYGYPSDEPFRVTFHPDRLHIPAHWKKPRRIFVCSMGDICHDDVTWNQMFSVFQMAGMIKWHKFIFLTKRPQRMYRELCGDLGIHLQRQSWCNEWPLKNLWLGVSVEDQKTADERIPILLQIPVAVRFVSYEPALGPVDFAGDDGGHHFFPFENEQGTVTPGIDWLIAGCESGPHRRPAKIEWFRSVKDQCVESGTPYFLKQMETWGGHFAKGQIVKMPFVWDRVWDQLPGGE